MKTIIDKSIRLLGSRLVRLCAKLSTYVEAGAAARDVKEGSRLLPGLFPNVNRSMCSCEGAYRAILAGDVESTFP